MTSSPRTLVLLSTYNSAGFLGEQIDSIQRQTWTDWELVIRDDGSTDSSPDIANDYSSRDRRVRVLRDDPSARLYPGKTTAPQLRAAESFGKLLAHAWRSGAEYTFLSDADDVWKPEKIERELQLLRERERATGGAVLVHSDLTVVDADLRIVHPSFREFDGIAYDREAPLRTLLLHNAVVGCTTAVNRAVLELAVPQPAGVLHDWWLAQCAAAAGDIVDITDSTMLYRQHRANATGTRGRRALRRRLVREPARFFSSAFANFDSGVRHVRELERRVLARPALVPTHRAAAISAYRQAFDPNAGVMARLAALRRSRVRPQRLVSTAFFYPLVIAHPHVA